MYPYHIKIMTKPWLVILGLTARALHFAGLYSEIHISTEVGNHPVPHASHISRIHLAVVPVWSPLVSALRIL
jgi:hypothetical protein